MEGKKSYKPSLSEKSTIIIYGIANSILQIIGQPKIKSEWLNPHELKTKVKEWMLIENIEALMLVQSFDSTELERRFTMILSVVEAVRSFQTVAISEDVVSDKLSEQYRFFYTNLYRRLIIDLKAEFDPELDEFNRAPKIVFSNFLSQLDEKGVLDPKNAYENLVVEAIEPFIYLLLGIPLYQESYDKLVEYIDTTTNRKTEEFASAMKSKVFTSLYPEGYVKGNWDFWVTAYCQYNKKQQKD